MHFVNPLFWLSALAVAVPVLLHLIRRDKSDRVPFPSLMFLHKIPRKELGRRRLSYLFLLFLRCLVMLLLVAAFARPVITHGWVQGTSPAPARSVIILVDHSLSMSRPPVWKRALQAVDSRIGSLREGDQARIMQFGQTAEVLSPWERSGDRLRKIFQSQVSPSFESTSYVEGLRVAVGQFQEEHGGKKEIYLITDLQRQGLAGSSGWRAPPDVDIQVKDVGSETSNVFVQEVRVAREVFAKESPQPILVDLRSTSSQVVRGEVQLFLEGQLVDRRKFELPEAGHATMTLKAFELKEGVKRGRIVIRPTDELPVDNTFFFVVERKEPRTIVVFSDPGKNSAFYFKNALSAGRNLPFQVQSATPGGVSPVSAAETPVIVLDSLSRPPRLSPFERYVSEGGSLILALSNSVRADEYNRSWGRFLGVELLDRNFVRSRDIPFTSMTEVSWEHPVFSVFQGLHRAAIVSSQFYGYWELAPHADAVVLARYSGGDPALIERLQGKGKIFVFASSLDPIWTDFPLRSVYVPFWHRMIEYAAGWKAAPAAMRIGQVLPLERWRDDSSNPANSGSPGGNVLDPKGRRVFRLSGERADFVPLELPGYYGIRVNKRTEWVAANPQPLESDLTRVPVGEFLAAVTTGRSEKSSGGALHDSADERERGQDFWWLFLIAAAIVLGAESVVANRFYAATQRVNR